jgi:hypothetical protein
MVQGALCGGEECESVKQVLASRRAAGEVAIRERLKRAKREGDLPADADPAALASFVATVMQGMSVQATGVQAATICKRSPRRRSAPSLREPPAHA